MITPKERPETLEGKTVKIPTGLGNVYITINELDGVPFEVFVSTGKCGQSVMAKAESVGRLASLALRAGIPIQAISRQLKGIAGDKPFPYKDGVVLSIPDAVGRVLENIYGTSTKEEIK